MSIRIVAALAACAVLSACSGLGLTGTTPGSSSAATAALQAFLTDPNCAHHDEANFVSGAAGIPASFQAKVMRDCPARPVAAPESP